MRPEEAARRARLERACVRIGECTLYREEAAFVLPLLTSIDAVVSDPPYGIDAAGRGTIGSGSKAIPATRFAARDWDKKPVAPELMALVLARARWQILFGGNYYKMPPASCWLVWDKQIGGDFADCELAWTNLPKAVRRIRYRWSGFLRQNNEPRGDHPTQKPVEVMKWCIAQLPEDAITILDPFMGSGTTGVACVQMGRRFIGIERDPEYFEAACRRIAAAHAQPRLTLVKPAPAEPQAAPPPDAPSHHGGSHMLIALAGIGSQLGLKLLSLSIALWSSRAGKLLIAIAVAAGLAWLAAELALTRAYERGVAATEARQEEARREAIAAAKAEGVAREDEIARVSAAEEAALREEEARKRKVRHETQSPDPMLLPADDPWLRSKRE
jgi:site-specific DNA-methyltransferase (adenine-specific)/modification methylase